LQSEVRPCGCPQAAQDFIYPLPRKGALVNNLIYIIGLVVVIIAILSFFGLR
jgi:hypothetical protein